VRLRKAIRARVLVRSTRSCAARERRESWRHRRVTLFCNAIHLMCRRRRRPASLAAVSTPRTQRLWRIDGIGVELPDGSKAWVINILDDHARSAIGTTATSRVTVLSAWRGHRSRQSPHTAPRGHPLRHRSSSATPASQHVSLKPRTRQISLSPRGTLLAYLTATMSTGRMSGSLASRSSATLPSSTGI
jgi:hypothetical protein